MSEKLSRRLFLKIAAALGASGALAWKSDDLKADDSPAEGGNETSAFPGLKEIITTGHIDGYTEKPFAPYCLGPGQSWDYTWGVDGEEIITRYGDGDTND